MGTRLRRAALCAMVAGAWAFPFHSGPTANVLPSSMSAPRLVAVSSGTSADSAEQQRTRQTGSSRAAAAVRESLKNTGFKYYCRVCNVGMGKLKNFEAHTHGRAHAANVQAQAQS